MARKKTDSVETNEKPTKERKKINPLLIFMRDLILLVALVFAFRAVVAEANWIPTTSMVPTLAVGDKIIVDKIGLRFGEIHRGDIVIFFPPDHPLVPEEQRKVRYIKRAIGLPGEMVEVQKDVGVFINGHKLYEPYVRGYPHDTLLPNYNYGPKEVPEGYYFLLGDNRQESRDSHIWEFCPEDNIIGRAMFRYWPLKKIGSIEDKDFREHYFEEDYP